MNSIKVQIDIIENHSVMKGDDDNIILNKCANQEILQKILNRFYTCRDFELSHVWQRSIFLGAFLILLLSGYGYYVTNFKNLDIFLLGICDYNFLGFLIADIGIAFSVIWIYMGKASKKWYEVYERIISDLENNNVLQIPTAYRMGKYHYHDGCKDTLFSTAAGNYSPSRLNILIGWGSLIIFFFVGVFHVFHLACIETFVINWYAKLFIAFIIMFVISVVINWTIDKCGKSQT